MTTLEMPKLPKKAQDGTLAKWLKQEGDAFAKGELLALVDLEDSRLELEAAQNGTLDRILLAQGQTAQPGAPLAEISPGGTPSQPQTSPKKESPMKESQAAGPQGTVTPILMPKAGNDMEEGTIVSWKVKEGDKISKGDVIFEIETDKATLEVEAEDEGVLQRIVTQEEESADVMTPVAYLGDSAEDVDAYVAQQGGGETEKSDQEEESEAPTEALPLPDDAKPVLMPKAGNDMEEGTIVSWKVKEGDKISKGDVIFEIETDKATLEVEAEEEGKLARIVVQEGESADVMTPVAYLAEDVEALDAYLASQKAAEKAPAPKAEEKPSAPAPAPSPAPAPAAPRAATAAGRSESGRVKASPAARKLAAERGVDLEGIRSGSGPYGRILSDDVAAAPVGKRGEAVSLSLAPRSTGDPCQTVKTPMTTMRKAISKNLTASKQNAPHFYMKMKVNAEALFRFYRTQKAACKASLNDVLLAAIGRNMAKYPAFRTQVKGEEFVEFKGANVGVAVALEDGLRVPVITGVDQLPLAQLAASTKQAIADTKTGKSVNMGKGTFTISNLGMTDIEEFTAIINPPEAAILAVGKIVEEVEVKNGAMRPTKAMTMWLSSDHRVIDGMLAAQFLGDLKKILEHPEVLERD